MNEIVTDFLILDDDDMDHGSVMITIFNGASYKNYTFDYNFFFNLFSDLVGFEELCDIGEIEYNPDKFRSQILNIIDRYVFWEKDKIIKENYLTWN